MKKVIRSIRSLFVLWQDNTSIAGQILEGLMVIGSAAFVYCFIQLIRCI